MAHEIVYELIWARDGFKSMRLVWEPATEHMSLYFRSEREAANGLVKALAEMIEYFDRRALTGPPWDGPVARNARNTLAELMGEAAPPDPLEKPAEQTELRQIG